MAKKTSDKKSLPTALKELNEMLATKQADLMGYKRGLAAGELKNPSIIRQTRKEVARLKTAITQHQVSKEGDN